MQTLAVPQPQPSVSRGRQFWHWLCHKVRSGYVRLIEFLFYRIQPCNEKFYLEMHNKTDDELRKEIVVRGLDGCSKRRYNALVSIAAIRFMAQGKPNDDNRN